jgi:hypothetical protein
LSLRERERERGGREDGRQAGVEGGWERVRQSQSSTSDLSGSNTPAGRPLIALLCSQSLCNEDGKVTPASDVNWLAERSRICNQDGKVTSASDVNWLPPRSRHSQAPMSANESLFTDVMLDDVFL